MKKFLYSIFMLTITFLIIYMLYYFLSDQNKTTTIVGKYKYYDELINLGYTEKEVKEIELTFNINDVKNYLLDTKYDYLLEYKKSEAFDIIHLDRYTKYEQSTNYTYDKVVKYVEIGLDKEFYSNVKEINNPHDTLVLVNKYNKLPNNFEANDLITLSKEYSSSYEKVKKVIVEDLKKLIDDAKEEGLKLNVVSGYRTSNKQKDLFAYSTNKYGLNHALIYSAKEGHSEHQTGLAIDFNYTEESFADTKEYKFLKENAHKYGFIERYQKDKDFITGYAYEPWHFRYVGKDAKTIYEQNLTLEEYIVINKDN